MRLTSAQLDWAYWGLLALVAAGLAAGLLVRVDGAPLLSVLVPPLKTLVERLSG